MREKNKFPRDSAIKNPPVIQETQETWVPVSARSPEEGMVTHSSILAWGIPWTGEPGGLQSIRLQSNTTEATEHTQLRKGTN